jgi:putative DNA-invertase from lambdoid prophage Rac
MKNRAVIYTRVSTHDQNTDNQTEVLEQWASQRGFELVEVYQEQESAWKAGHQRELARLMTNAQRGRFQHVLVWALDRVSREGPLAILQTVHKFTKWGVTVHSYQEPWTEAGGEMTDLLLAITGWVACYESQRRSERTKAGMARAQAAGKHIGRPMGTKGKRRRGHDRG